MFLLLLRMLSSVIKDNPGDVSDQNLISSIWLYICTGPERGHFIPSLPYQERAPLSNLIKGLKVMIQDCLYRNIQSLYNYLPIIGEVNRCE